MKDRIQLLIKAGTEAFKRWRRTDAGRRRFSATASPFLFEHQDQGPGHHVIGFGEFMGTASPEERQDPKNSN